MTERPRFMDDLAGMAGGAFSAVTGLRDEMEAMLRARLDDTIRRLDLVRREDLEAVQELAANARAGQEAADRRIAALEAKLALHDRVTPEIGIGDDPVVDDMLDPESDGL